MPARVVVVLPAHDLAIEVAEALNAETYDAVSLSDSMAAIKTLEHAQTVDLLITSLEFSAGQPNGISLALITRKMRPNVKVLFIGPEELKQFTNGLGTLIEPSLPVTDIVRHAREVLDPPPPP